MEKGVKKEADDLLVCLKCGANMELRSEDGRDIAACPYCGFSRVIPKEKDDDDRAAALREFLYERERARLKAEDEHSAMLNARVKRGKRIALAIILTPIVIGLIIGIITAIFGDPTKPRIDPFKDATVTFSGVDGAGGAEISGTAGVTYTCEDNGELAENGTALITARSENYNLSRKKCEFTVTGLDLYITDVSMLDAECIDFLREHTAAELNKEFSATGDFFSAATKHYESWEWAPAGVFVISNGPRADRVFDVIKLTFTRGEVTVTKYAAYCFENAVRRRGGIAPVSFRREYLYGPTSNIGALGAGDNTVWGTYMGVMTGYDTLEEVESSLRADFAGWSSFQKIEG